MNKRLLKITMFLPFLVCSGETVLSTMQASQHVTVGEDRLSELVFEHCVRLLHISYSLLTSSPHSFSVSSDIL